MNPYLADILAQPEALRQAADQFSAQSLAPIQGRLERSEFDRIVITGMGASLNAAYPAVIHLSELGMPVLHLDTAELLHYLRNTVGTKALLWINSQSGRSAEPLNLLEQTQSVRPACILACVNDETSPLADAADVCLPIHAGPETAVSTKTYLNTLAVNLLAAEVLLGGEIADLKADLHQAADAIENYLDKWEVHLETLDGLLGDFDTLVILGRGASMGAVWNGALICKEAAKCAFEGLNAAAFRHGPLELAAPSFLALIFAGASKTAALNRKLALDIIEYGGRVLWVDVHDDEELPTITMPDVPDLTRPLGEILPMQMLTLVMARRKKITAGKFRVIRKVTYRE
jgi:glucosamine--fructose-6-phosphate aminotransferase (isomerizing)